MRIDYLIDTPVDQRGFALRASARYRAIIPGRALAESGDAVRTLTLAQAERSVGVDIPDVLVVGKLFRSGGQEYIAACLERGARLVIDFCDDNFQRYDFDGAYGPFLAQAAALTASTAVLAERIQARLGRPAQVIGDPYEGPAGAPRFAPDANRVKLVWFGASRSLDTLTALADGMAAWRRRSTALGGRAVALALSTAINHIDAGPAQMLTKLDAHCDLILKIWSPKAVWALLAASDIALLPSHDHPFFATKSANRLLETLHAGRIAAAQPVAAYQPFAAGCFIADDIFDAIDAALVDPTATLARIHHGQNLARSLASPPAIAAQWRALFARLTSAS